MLFGWLPADPAETPTVLASMAAALRVTSGQRPTMWTLGHLGIGLLALRGVAMEDESCDPARSADGMYLWMSGEAFDWPSQGGIRSATESRSLAFRRRLLDALRSRGPEAIRDLDGEYQIALWNPPARTLLLLNDRFAALPLYVGASAHGTAFGGGVRGVLMGPGIAADPDVEAIQEAVSFGGYRLGTRTNVRSVRMIPPASAVSISPDAMTAKRYWTWSELRDGDGTDSEALLEDVRSAWTGAIRKRLDGSHSPGLTLSGGLDSRAILAEATRQGRVMTALTYGVPQADDVKIAGRVARAASARWKLHSLYTGGWFERRTSHILETDGLMDLVDLMHTEALDVMPESFDIYLSGYIGDVVSGATYLRISSPEQLLASMPYYGGRLGFSYERALDIARGLIAATPGAPRFAPYEQKLPQAISRISAAARPYATVRRPFVDYAFFEAAQRVPAAWRDRHEWHEQWLVSTYPELFDTIPNQRTGVPPGASWLQWHVTRAARFGWRRALQAAQAVGAPVTVPVRTYHPDERFWSMPAERAMIEQTVLRPESLSCDVFGRGRVRATLQDFFERGEAPVQVIGALYVFERYHQAVGTFLADAGRQIRTYAC